MITIESLICEFPDGDGKTIRALSIPYEKLENGAWALTGPSGSGKTTLLHCLSGLITPTRGHIFIQDKDITQMTAKERCDFRAHQVGYMFQKPLLLPYLNVEENLQISATLSGNSISKKDISCLLESVGLGGYETRTVRKLSGGEAQRVSFLRAILRKPSIFLADEPTASLDSKNGKLLIEKMLSYQKESQCLLICATHDEKVKEQFINHLVLERGEMKL